MTIALRRPRFSPFKGWSFSHLLSSGGARCKLHRHKRSLSEGSTIRRSCSSKPFVFLPRGGHRKDHRESLRAEHLDSTQVNRKKLPLLLQGALTSNQSREPSLLYQCQEDAQCEEQLSGSVHEDSLISNDATRTSTHHDASCSSEDERGRPNQAGNPNYHRRHDGTHRNAAGLGDKGDFTVRMDDGEPLVRDQLTDSTSFFLAKEGSASIGLEHATEDIKGKPVPGFSLPSFRRRRRAAYLAFIRGKKARSAAHSDYTSKISDYSTVSRKADGRIDGCLKVLHSAQHKEGGSTDGSSIEGRVRSGPKKATSSCKTQRYSSDFPFLDSLSGQVCRNFDRVGHPDGPFGKCDHSGGLAWVPSEKRTPFKGHTFTRRSEQSRVASSPDDFSYPLQQLNVPALNVEVLRSMMLPDVQTRFDTLWSMLSVGPTVVGPPPVRRLRLDDAKILLESGIIQHAGPSETRGWIIPFSVLEEKPSGIRRRFIAWPKGKNEDEFYIPEVPLQHVSNYLNAVRQPGAALFDLKASFYQIALPEKARSVFRMLGEDGVCYELIRLPMGYRISPELMQLLVSALSGDSSVVRDGFQAPASVKVDVWIDNIRVSGSEKEVRTLSSVIERRAALGGVTFGEVSHFTTDYTFIGVHFNHLSGTVSLAEKTLQRVRTAAPWDSMTLSQLESFASRCLFGAAVLGFSIFQYYFFFKFVRWKLSQLNRGLVDINDVADISLEALRAGSSLKQRLCDNTPRAITEFPSRVESVLVTDASNSGWGAVLFLNNGGVHVAGQRWQESEALLPPDFDKIHISQKEARAILYGLVSFEDKLPDALKIYCDNTAVYCSAKKGSSKNEGIALNCAAIDSFLNSRHIDATFSYIRSDHNIADLPSRGKEVTASDLAKWEKWRGGDADPWKS